MRGKWEQLVAAIRRHGNAVSTAQAESAGISRALLAYYAARGSVVRVRHGVYALPDDLRDEMAETLRVASHAVLSHETALFLHGLTNRTPFRLMLTIPSDTSLPASLKGAVRCFYVSPQLHRLGMSTAINNLGHKVRCYDAERTICDLLRSRSRCDEETVISALKNYAASGTINAPLLADYADRLGIMKTLKPYMEVLL